MNTARPQVAAADTPAPVAAEAPGGSLDQLVLELHLADFDAPRIVVSGSPTVPLVARLPWSDFHYGAVELT